MGQFGPGVRPAHGALKYWILNIEYSYMNVRHIELCILQKNAIWPIDGSWGYPTVYPPNQLCAGYQPVPAAVPEDE